MLNRASSGSIVRETQFIEIYSHMRARFPNCRLIASVCCCRQWRPLRLSLPSLSPPESTTCCAMAISSRRVPQLTPGWLIWTADFFYLIALGLQLRHSMGPRQRSRRITPIASKQRSIPQRPTPRFARCCKRSWKCALPCLRIGAQRNEAVTHSWWRKVA